MQAELSVATFVKVNNIGTLLPTQKAQDETGDVLIFLAASLLLVKQRVYSPSWPLWVEGRLVTDGVHLLFLSARRQFCAH